MKKFKLLVCCEESKRVCMAFRERGWEEYSCDIEPESVVIQNVIFSKR